MNFRMLLSIAFITVLTACGGAEERKAVYMEKAKSSIEAGDLDKARIELKNVLQIDPKDAEAYYELGRVYEQQKEYRKAYGSYLKAEELNPELLANQAILGRFNLLLLNDLDKAQQKVDYILSKEPNNLDGLLLKAAIALRTKGIADAIVLAKDVVTKDPAHVEGAAFLASSYLKYNKKAEAINTLDNALKHNQNNELLNKLLASVLVKDKDYERAEVIYKKFLERNPDSASSYNNLAIFYIQTGDKVKAEETLRLSINNQPDDVDRLLTLVKYIRSVKSNEDAITEIKVFIKENKSLGKLRTALAELYLLSGDNYSAIDIYKEAIKDFSDEQTGVDARIALASVYISDKDYTKASEAMEEAINISPNDPKVNFLRAKLALNDKDVEKAILSLRVATKEDPENIEAFILLANAYAFEKNDEQVHSILNSAYDNNKTNADALLKLAQYHLSRDVAQAEKIIDDYNNLKESDYEGMSIKGAILNQKKDFSGAYGIAEKLMQKFPDKPNGYLQAMSYYNQKSDMNSATSVLEKGYINVEDNRNILIALTRQQVSEKKFDVVEKRIKAELDKSPNDVDLKMLLSKVYIASNNIDSAKLVLNEMIQSKADMEEPYLLLAQIYQSQKDLSSVKNILEKGKNSSVSSTKIPLRLAAIYELDGDYQKAINVYRELYESYPENLIIINNLASMLSDHSENKDDLALTLILAEQLQKSDQPVLLDTVGWVYYKNGDYQTAIQHLSQVVETMPDVNVFNYHLGMAYKMAGDKAQAKVYLEKSLADNKPFAQKEMAVTALKEL